ncbi:MAG: cell envelope integrity protein TolA [Pseudomonadota bacterium]
MIEDFQFRKMIWWSAAVHVVLIAATATVTSRAASRLTLEPSGGPPLNVMWASTVQGPPKTPDNKLPAPQVQPVPPPPAKREEARVVAPKAKITKAEKRKAEKEAKTAREEEARRKAMAAAIASLESSVAHQPTPRPDNFPSIPGVAGQKGAVPAAPFGGVRGSGAIDPELAAYMEQVKQLISGNLIWLNQVKPVVVVEFHIDSAGNIENATISKNSGNPSYDAAVLRAVKKSSPIPLPPPKFAAELQDGFAIQFDLK